MKNTWIDYIIGAGVGLLIFGGLVWGGDIAASDWTQGLPPCAEEDSNNCYWDSSERGNGNGLDFITINDEVIYQ